MKTWHQYMYERINGKEKNIPWFLHDKIKFNNFCNKNIIPVPKIIEIFDSPNEINLNAVNLNEFILKPSLESSTKGVMVLKKLESGSFYDSLSKQCYRFDEIVSLQNKYFELNKSTANKIIIEEKIYDADETFIIPRDFKFYAFKGNIALILEVNRNLKPAISCWYDTNFNPVDEKIISCNAPYSRTLSYFKRPDNFKSLLELAKQVSSLIDTPFARIDMYNSINGPVMGEVTLAPGGTYYGKHYTLSNEYESLMGDLWSANLP